MATNFEIPAAIRGVFAYLDATLPPAAIADLGRDIVCMGHDSLTDWRSWPRKAMEIIADEFRLMYPHAPIRKALDAFHLYHKTDMASALVCAYRLHLRARDPHEALNADYSVKWGGILSWKSMEEVQHEAGSGHSLWHRFSSFYREGDRFVGYSLPTVMGTMLVRGDRLVWDVVEMNMCVEKPSLRWLVARDKFQELGGNRAFLAGEFVWPPAGWTNPVTDEQEAEHLGNELRGMVNHAADN